MQHTISTSADGSSTLKLTEFGESYHSTNGAFTEAMHIYIKAGVEHLFQKLCSTVKSTCENNLPGAENTLQKTPIHINIFDVGFGTALNCILLYSWQQQLRQQGLTYPQIHYYGIEKYPIQPTEAQQLNYPTIIAQQLHLLPDKLTEIFHLMHNCQWEIANRIRNVIPLNSYCTSPALTLQHWKKNTIGKHVELRGLPWYSMTHSPLPHSHTCGMRRFSATLPQDALPAPCWSPTAAKEP